MTFAKWLVFGILCVVRTYADGDVIVAKSDVPSEVYRLPQTVFPEYYTLNVLTHIDDDVGFRFLGNVSILVSFNLHTDSVFFFFLFFLVI